MTPAEPLPGVPVPGEPWPGGSLPGERLPRELPVVAGSGAGLAGARAGELARQIVSALSERHVTVAVAESLTGGLVCATLVSVPGAYAVVRGAVVAYATELKARVLGVDADLLSANGPVDPEVAAQMAAGVRGLMGSDYGLATTGVAGPGPADGAPAGRVFVAVSGPSAPTGSSGPDQRLYPRVGDRPDGARVLRLDLPGDREAVRAGSTERVLGLLLSVLDGTGRPR